ncbi:MAG: hypothetical protein IT567_06770 [Alphaproteobacteria bacterium]|nr:hypothetical protein [Alphaproteobacteria bacterium]
MDDMDSTLELLLRSRKVEPPRPGMAERIIMAAHATPQRVRVPFGVWLQRLCAEFYMPRPAFAFAMLLLIGFITGLGVPVDMDTDENGISQPASLQDFLYPEEDSAL